MKGLTSGFADDLDIKFWRGLWRSTHELRTKQDEFWVSTLEIYVNPFEVYGQVIGCHRWCWSAWLRAKWASAWKKIFLWIDGQTIEEVRYGVRLYKNRSI